MDEHASAPTAPSRPRRRAPVRDRIVELRRVRAGDLVPHPANWRRHPEPQRAALRALLGRIGYADALLVRPDGDALQLIDGHLRQSLDPDQEVPVLVLDVTAKEAETLLASIDPLAALARPDPEALAALLERVDRSNDAIRKLFEDLARTAGLPVVRGLADPDDAPGLPATARTKPGDLYALGEHRLLCGDATDPAHLERVTGGEVATVVFTDPPWNVAIGEDSNPRHRRRPGLANDDLPEEEFAGLLRSFATAVAPHVGGDLYCVLGASRWPVLDRALREAGFHWSATVVWVKDAFVLGRSKYHRRYEPIWFGWHKGAASSFRGGRREDDVWEIPRPTRSAEHPTMKPVALISRAIRNSSGTGDLVLDPFVGSGSTIIACEQHERRCAAVEIDPAYCDVAVARWESFTGRSATLIEGAGP